MKRFEVYMIEEDFLKTYGLKRNELFCEFLGFDLAPKDGPAYSRQFAGRKYTNPRKIFFADNDDIFTKFIEMATRKLGGFVVAGALLFLKVSYKSIEYLLRSVGKTLASILEYLAEKGQSVLVKLYNSLKEYLESNTELSKEEKQHVMEILK